MNDPDFDPLELLARLSASTIRFDIGAGGGGAGMTGVHYAAALAKVTDPLGEDLMFLRAGAGDQVRRERALKALAARQHAEWGRQSRMEQSARLQLRISQDAHDSVRSPSIHERQALAEARAEHARAKAAMWTSEQAPLPALRLAVLREVCQPNQCQACKGRMAVLEGERMVDCTLCEKRGFLYLRDAERATSIGRDPSTFQRVWRPIYNWTLAAAQDAFFTAMGQFRRSIGTQSL